MENLSSHFTPVIVKCMKNNVDITKLRYSGFTVKSPESHLTRSYVARNQSYVARNFTMLNNILASLLPFAALVFF